MIAKMYGSLIVLSILAATVFSQSKPSYPTHESNWCKVAPVNSLATGLTFNGYLPEKGVQFRTTPELWSFTFNAILGLDEKSGYPASSGMGVTSDWLAKGTLLLPVSLMADPGLRRNANMISVHLSETVLLTYGATKLYRVFASNNQPFTITENTPVETRLRPSGGLSFFTGHTSMAASLSFFSAKVWFDYHPDSKLKPFVWTVAIGIPAVTGYLQYRSGRQFIADVGTEYLIGALAGYLIPHLHKIDRRSKRKFRMSSSMIDKVPVFSVKYRL